MIQQFFNGVLAIMLAKFMLNDVPHAVGLFHIKPTPLTTYRMRCPRCGYGYSVTLHTEPYGWELCPICGYGAPFREFVKRE